MTWLTFEYIFFFVIYSTFAHILVSYRNVVKKTFKEQLRLDLNIYYKVEPQCRSFG